MVVVSFVIRTWISPDKRIRVLRVTKGNRKVGSFPTRGSRKPSEQRCGPWCLKRGVWGGILVASLGRNHAAIGN